MSKRVFLIVLDSFGIGAQPDAPDYGDEGSNTLLAISKSHFFKASNMARLGLFNIEGVRETALEEYMTGDPSGAYGRLTEASVGKDTTTGHWELAGLITDNDFPLYPNGFPDEIINEFERLTGHRTICNMPYSGTEAIKDFGDEHVATKALIVYTSADSVFQIAAHEEIIPLDLLYDYCKIARRILTGEHAVGRVIARPFTGISGNYTRTENRKDFSLEPTGTTMLDYLSEAGFDVISIGKISDIFAGRGITQAIKSKNNNEGIEAILKVLKEDFEGLCFLNLVDFDMLFGHRNDVDGYARAISDFDEKLPSILSGLKQDDLLIITADHGCDPSSPSTDHSREYVPLLLHGKRIDPRDLGTLETFADTAATILDHFGLDKKVCGKSIFKKYPGVIS